MVPQPVSWRGKFRSPGFLSLILALATVAIYMAVAWHDFVGYDDPDYVTANTHVLGGLKWDNILWAFTTGHAGNWHPLTWLSHMLDCQLFGPSPGPQHLVSAGFHVANTIVLFLLLRGLTGALWRSALVAALFALHPLHVESVAWMAERKDVLSGFFFLLTVWAYAKYALVGRVCPSAPLPATLEPGALGQTRPTLSFMERRHLQGNTLNASRYYTLALGFFALGLMSKPMLVTLPFVLLLLDYWPLRRLRFGSPGGARTFLSAATSDNPTPGSPESISTFADRCGQECPRSALGYLVWEKIPFFALSLLSSYISFIVQRKSGAVVTSLSIGARIANALVSYVRYLGKIFWPDNLAVLYPHPGLWPTWQVSAAAAVLLLLSALVLVLRRKRPWLVTGWLWFVGMLVPVSGIIQVGVQSMADRYTYLPSVGLLIIVVWGVSDSLVAADVRRRISRPDLPWIMVVGAWIFAISLLLGCALVTSRQLRYWRDSEALFTHAIQVTRSNYVAYNNLGFCFLGQGKTAEAIENFRMALEINPGYEDALRNMGFALASERRSAEAIPYYEAALRLGPRHFEMHYALANLLAETGRLDDAIDHYRQLLEQEPEHVDGRNNLGIALAMRGRLDEAIAQFREALRYNLNDANTHNNLGNALEEQHKPNEAVKEYQESLRLKPDDPQTHYNLGMAQAELGSLAEAVVQFQETLRLSPQLPEAHLNLGMALVKQGRREEAVGHFREALRLKPDYAEARQQLEAISAPQQK